MIPTTVDLSTFLKVAESKAVDVMLWMLEHKDEHNRLYVTLDFLSIECGVTKVTINKLFQKLYKFGFLKKIRNGQYMLHPSLLPSKHSPDKKKDLKDWLEIQN